jgi:hypothetical protein
MHIGAKRFSSGTAQLTLPTSAEKYDTVLASQLDRNCLSPLFIL